MSAYMVDKVHIDLLVDVAIRGPRGRVVSPDHAWYAPTFGATRRPSVLENADDLGQMLTSENLRSINARYPDTLEGGDIPGTIGDDYSDYTFTAPRYRLTAVEALMAVSCYEYQACESSDWGTTDAHEFCDSLRHSLIHCLDGIDKAPWSWNAETVRKHMVTA